MKKQQLANVEHVNTVTLPYVFSRVGGFLSLTIIILNFALRDYTRYRYKANLANKLSSSKDPLKEKKLQQLIELSMSGENIVLLTEQAFQ